jgi:serine/threonine protein kinase
MIGTNKDQSSLIKTNSQLKKARSQGLLLRNHSLTKKHVQIGQYIYNPEKDRIGEGYCSEVFKAVQNTPPYKIFALKKIDMRHFRDTNMEFTQSEVSLHKRLNHANIIKFIEVIKTQNYYYIILEYCSQGTLEDYIKK